MKKNFFIIFLITLILSPSVLSVSIKNNQLKQNSPKLDLCPECVELMNGFINELLNAILNGGVIGSCDALCQVVPNPALSFVCQVVCDYVGITAFIDAINITDPDPIFICQEIDICSVVENGAVSITSAFSTPQSGSLGTTFTIGMNYKVINATGPGLLSIVILPPDSGFPMSDAEFTDGQTPGEYQISWQIEALPSENEPFSSGVYKVGLAVCAGDCSTVHRWGGIYAEASTSFTTEERRNV